MCWRRVGEANPLFSVCITLWRWTATATLSTLRKWCYTPLQHDFALDPMIPPFFKHLSRDYEKTTITAMYHGRWFAYKQTNNIWLRKEHVLRPPFFGQGTTSFFFLMVICNSLLLLKSLPINIINCIKFYVNCSALTSEPLYKSLHQSFFYSFITILPSESGATLHYSTILP
jgi:hypothetical protein